MKSRNGKRLITNVSITLTADCTPGGGKLLDLTPKGCRIRSNVAFNNPKELRLTVTSPFSEFPISVEKAVVRWSKDDEMGLEFIHIKPDEEARLVAYLNNLEAERQVLLPFIPEIQQEVLSPSQENPSPLTLKSPWWKVSFSR